MTRRQVGSGLASLGLVLLVLFFAASVSALIGGASTYLFVATAMSDPDSPVMCGDEPMPQTGYECVLEGVGRPISGAEYDDMLENQRRQYQQDQERKDQAGQVALAGAVGTALAYIGMSLCRNNPRR